MSLVNSIFVDAMVADNNDELEEKVEKYLLPSVISRVKDYLNAVDKEFIDPKSSSSQ